MRTQKILHIKLIVNPTAGKIQANLFNIKKLMQKLSQNNILAEVIYTTANDDDKYLILHNLNQKDAVIVCGGDGTLNRVITYMIQNNSFAPILFLPAGTANVFRLEKNLSRDIDEVIETLLYGKTVKTDIGLVEHSGGVNYFLLMLSVGIDSKSVDEADMNVKKILGKTSYLFSGVKNFITYKPKQLEVVANNQKFEDVHTVIISNSRLYGGNIELFPLANMHDGFLDMCVFMAENNVLLLKHIVDIQSGNHENNPNIKYFQIKSAFISSISDEKMPFQIDGECAGHLPIKVSILKNKIDFILPHNS